MNRNLAGNKKALIDRYNRKALRYGSTWPSTNDDHITAAVQEALKELASPRSSDIVLDVGTGRRARYLTLLGESSFRAVGIDISDMTVQVAREYLRGNSGRFWNLVVASGDGLPFKDRFFTLVTCSEVLEYYGLEDCENILNEIHRVLKTDGRSIVDFPDHEDARSWQLKESEENEGVSFFIYPEEKIAQTLRHCGFAILKRQKVDVEIQYLLQPMSA